MRWRATYLPVNIRHGVKVADRYLLAIFAINKKSCFLRGGLWEFDGYKPVNDFDKKNPTPFGKEQRFFLNCLWGISEWETEEYKVSWAENNRENSL